MVLILIAYRYDIYNSNVEYVVCILLTCDYLWRIGHYGWECEPKNWLEMEIKPGECFVPMLCFVRLIFFKPIAPFRLSFDAVTYTHTHTCAHLDCDEEGFSHIWFHASVVLMKWWWTTVQSWKRHRKGNRIHQYYDDIWVEVDSLFVIAQKRNHINPISD